MFRDDDDELLCPITHQVFHDHVLVEDRRLYEQEIITQ